MHEKKLGFVDEGLGGRLRTMMTGVVVVLALALSTGHAKADEMGETLIDRQFNMIIEGGYRYPFLGHSYIPGDGFPVAFHAAVSYMLGFAGNSGLYLNGRFDNFAPRGRGFPMMGQVRVGYFFNTHHYEEAAIHQSTSYNTQCGYVYCTTTANTRQWYEPPGWVSGVMYFYAGYRQGFHFEGDADPVTGVRELAFPGAVSAGMGFLETKFATFLNEFEVMYWPFGWQDSGRSKWGVQYRGAALFGPIFIDFTGILDAGMGGELSLGLGFMYSP